MVEYGRPDLWMMVQGVGTNLINECIGCPEDGLGTIAYKAKGFLIVHKLGKARCICLSFQRLLKGYLCLWGCSSQWRTDELMSSVDVAKGFSTERNVLLVVSYTSIFDGHFSVTTGFVSITPTVTGLCLLHPPLELTFFVYVFLDKPELISPHSLTASVATYSNLAFEPSLCFESTVGPRLPSRGFASLRTGSLEIVPRSDDVHVSPAARESSVRASELSALNDRESDRED
ncbi:hypothetical protein DY000_02058541 [Brassica cretica]|uniref:Uncharacterized protein n=1 Tax=Brassica cretica TaxID=69181 RepID=A0ABQ7AWK7_BRACR|nr:hypothetical protein DY000_02058541 [Brassica cretica]